VSRRGNGEGSIFQRKDRRWVAKLSHGANRPEWLYGRTRADVAEKLAAALKARQDGLPVFSKRRTTGTYLAEWLKGARGTLRPRTWTRYEQYVRLHAELLASVPLARLTPQNLRRLYAERQAAGCSSTSVHHLHAVLHRALEQATRDGEIPRNVASLVTPPQIAHHEMQTLSPVQTRALLEAIVTNRLEAVYVVAVTTGMRQGEILALKWADVDLERGSLRVVATLQRTKAEGFVFAPPKTAHSRRQVALTQAAIAALRRHRTRQIEERLAVAAVWEDRDLVFCDQVGGPLDGTCVTAAFRTLLRRAGLPRLRFHDLRHTAATLMLGQGVHQKIVSEMLGHATVAITLDLYSHVTPTMQRTAAAELDAVLAAN
jgi:integrase